MCVCVCVVCARVCLRTLCFSSFWAVLFLIFVISNRNGPKGHLTSPKPWGICFGRFRAIWGPNPFHFCFFSFFFCRHKGKKHQKKHFSRSKQDFVYVGFSSDIARGKPNKKLHTPTKNTPQITRALWEPPTSKTTKQNHYAISKICSPRKLLQQIAMVSASAIDKTFFMVQLVTSKVGLTWSSSRLTTLHVCVYI